ncbi:hypothetical protein GDO81_028454 [Engystomops pustulosus]|uniref:Pre-mRNA-splicing factor SYF2 n=1 Tax=Engystomops pustulosus TaxID=76066 RepID=A0AAV6YH86_ENGPU|nr:hypothetical protein GDO81_028454 [Engystomops pustulosus]
MGDPIMCQGRTDPSCLPAPIQECAANGVDYERAKLLEISADDAERWERKKKKRNPDIGFSDYAAAQLRQYQRLTRQIKPDMEEYQKEREKQ